MPKYLSSEAQDLIDGILKVQVRDRLTVEEILDHPWLEDVEIGVGMTTEQKDLITIEDVEEDLADMLQPVKDVKTEQEVEPEPHKEKETEQDSQTPKFKHSKTRIKKKKPLINIKDTDCEIIKEEDEEAELDRGGEPNEHNYENMNPNVPRIPIKQAQKEFLNQKKKRLNTSGLREFEHESEKIKFSIDNTGNIRILIFQK